MKLDDLIGTVRSSAASDEPLDQLSAAMGVKADLDELTDSLIGHFVDQARRAGRSWSEIGAAMGVTKQAAQQRHTSERPRKRDRRLPVMGRMTGRAKTAVREASEAAAELGHGFLGTEHLLLGVLAVPQSVGAKAVTGLGLTREHVLAAVPAGDGTDRTTGRRRHKPFTPLAVRAMEQAMGEALRLGHNYVGTEHVVLALRRVEEGVAARAMTAAGIDADALQADIVERLTGAA